VNRNFGELLQEVRVAQTGVQILFAFLLTVPFSNRWPRVTALQEIVYTLTVLACAVAVALLVAPVSLHRQVFRQGRKQDVVRWADNLARAGLRALLLAVIGSVFLVLDAVRGVALAAPLTAVVALLYVLLWYRLPRPDPDDPPEPESVSGRPGQGFPG
jgi:O-antigen/teichoic acid export membrane protein